jgi:hypothetical protein
MNIQTRVEKLEQATGINEPCEICDLIEDYVKRELKMMAELRLPIRESPRPVIMSRTCPWCLRSADSDRSLFTLSERVLFERRAAAAAQGQLCLPENATLDEEITAAFARVDRELYGPHYEACAGLRERFKAEVERVVARNKPRFHYLCRVEGCTCEYPKTEEEFLRRHGAIRVGRRMNVNLR